MAENRVLPRRVEIAKFPGNKRIAFTTSFDDGVLHDKRVLEAFNKWGIKGTWNLNSGHFTNPASAGKTVRAEEVAAVYAGHEVAIHTVNHPHLPRLDANQIALEVLDDRRALEDLVGYPVRGMAYPYGTYDRRVIEVLRALGIVYCRTTERRDPCFPPEEPLAWGATGHQYDEGIPKKWEDFYENSRSNGVFFIWGHTYEFNDRNDWEALERIYKPMAGKADVWYCTNIELFDYEAARRRVVIAANRGSAYNPSGMAVTLLVDGEAREIGAGETVAFSSTLSN